MQKPGESWRSRLSVASFILVFLYPLIAPAGEMKIIPPWTRMKGCVVTVEDSPNIRACYNYGESKLLKKLDMDIHLKYQKLELLKSINVELLNSVIKLEEVVRKEQENTLIMQNRVEEKQGHLEDMADLFISANKRDVFGGALPWVITALVVFAAVGFVGGYYTAK